MLPGAPPLTGLRPLRGRSPLRGLRPRRGRSPLRGLRPVRGGAPFGAEPRVTFLIIVWIFLDFLGFDWIWMDLDETSENQ